jgi:hypothetical protein
MRYTTAAVVLAGTVAAYNYDVPEVSTAYTTDLVTVTKCPDSVPDCPANSMTTSVSITSVPVIPTTVITPVISPSPQHGTRPTKTMKEADKQAHAPNEAAKA